MPKRIAYPSTFRSWADGGDIETAVVSMYSTHPSPSRRDKLEFASRRMALRLYCCGIDADDYVGRNVLDAGCGTGEYACWFAAHGSQVTGIDLSDGSLSEARAYARQERLRNVVFETRSVLDTGLPSDSYDLVYCTGVLHHIENSYNGLRELTRVLRPGGKILISLYNAVEFMPLVYDLNPNDEASWVEAFGFSFDGLAAAWREDLLAAWEATPDREALARRYRTESPARYQPFCDD
jgi:SAM-dependent methyltransferase